MSTFQPLLGTHAIERCSITIGFSAALPDKLYQRKRDNIAADLLKAGMQSQNQSPGFEIDLTTGQTRPVTHGGISVFNSSDRANALTVTPNSLTWQTTRYIRWAPLIAQISNHVLPAVRAYCEALEVSLLRLDYQDRFLWSGSWDTFDISKLIKPNSEFVATAAAKGAREWHSHSGWFEYVGNLRRLVNANVDVVALAGPTPQPTVGIYTMVQEQSFDGSSNTAIVQPDGIIERLQLVHIDMKRLLGQIITQSMADRINLKPGG